MPSTTTFSIILLLLSFTLRPLSSTSALHPRRILHQPLLPQDSPPPTPSPPPHPKYPFTTSTPENSPFFPFDPSPPPPPSPASFASFPANISSLAVPHPSNPHSTSSKLIPAAIAAVVAAVAVVSLAVFLHLRKRSSFSDTKTRRSDNGSTVSFNQAPNTGHIPKLQRPSQSSAEFLYLGTLVSSHAPGGFSSTTNYNNGSDTRKLDSPELSPLPPLDTRRQHFRNNEGVVSSKDDESEQFYSPKGSINGKESSIGTESASRRGFAAIEVENFDGSTSNSSSTYCYSVPGPGSGSVSPVPSMSPLNNLSSIPMSPLNNLSSIPKSPDLIEIQTIPPETRGLLLHESASPSPPSSSSPDRYSRRSEESSPRISNVSDTNDESPVISNSPFHHSTTVIPTLEEIRGSVLPQSASPERYLRRSEESTPRNSNVSDQNVESPEIPPEILGLVLPESTSPAKYSRRSDESSPRNSNVSDQNVESRATPLEILGLVLPESTSPAKYSRRSDESSPRNSNVSHQNVESPATEPEILGSTSPAKYPRRSDESSPRNSNVSDQNVESPVRSTTVIPTGPTSSLCLLSPERYLGKNEEQSPRVSNASDEVVKSPVSSPVQHNTILILTDGLEENVDKILVSEAIELEQIIKTEQAIEPKHEQLEELTDECSRSEESSSMISNVHDQNVASPVTMSSSVQHKPPLPMSLSLGSEESSSSILGEPDQEMEHLMRNSSSAQPKVTVFPTPPPPPPPPPPPSKVCQSPKTPTPPAKMPVEPPVLLNPLRPIAVESPTLISPIELPSNDSQTEDSSKDVEWNGESPPKPKLKTLHWDKVRASSDREMVWDQLKCSSFRLNEEMMETLFVVNTSKPNPKETTRWQILPTPGQDNGNRVLDPKKAQNIAILLRALHVTVDEVCEGLLEGNVDILGTELLESLLKMAPTKEEERKLKEYKDDSPIKLGLAEKFLKAIVDIPHAFRRVDAMLYISNFESEVEYLKKSFGTLEAACEELRSSRMFLKLLEAVLKTGNRMNVGTNRGDAHAFKLDTLLKLVDVKGADGKTTLLHFVVQEIIRSEGARLSGGSPQDDSFINDDAKCRKLGLQVVSSLSSELSNVKKAAVMDAEVLSSDVSKLSKGIGNVREIVTLNDAVSSQESGSHKFSDSMNSFMKKAEEEIFRIQAQESVALSLVKEITEYFHGDSAKEEAHPFRIFMVVKDFVTVLDRVCKEVGMINERTIVSSALKFPVPVNPMLQQVHKPQCTSSDDESVPP